MATKPEIAKCIALLCEAYGRKPTAATFLAYELGVDGVSDEQLRLATQAVLQQSRQYMPTPGELRESAMVGGGTYRDRAEVAWLEFDRNNGDVDDPISKEVCRAFGGWSRMGAMPKADYYAYVRPQFVDRYEAILKSPRAELLQLDAAVDQKLLPTP